MAEKTQNSLGSSMTGEESKNSEKKIDTIVKKLSSQTSRSGDLEQEMRSLLQIPSNKQDEVFRSTEYKELMSTVSTQSDSAQSNDGQKQFSNKLRSNLMTLINKFDLNPAEGQSEQGEENSGQGRRSEDSGQGRAM